MNVEMNSGKHWLVLDVYQKQAKAVVELRARDEWHCRHRVEKLETNSAHTKAKLTPERRFELKNGGDCRGDRD